MNKIIKPVTGDGKCGYDEFGQFCVWTYEERHGGEVGRIMADVRGQTCLLCGSKWEAVTRQIADQHYDHSAETMVHMSCWIRHLSYLDRGNWITDLAKGGVYRETLKAFEAIPNQYGGAWNTPWYKVTINAPGYPVLTVGARKRVDSILIERLTREQAERIAEKLKDENTTKEPGTDSYAIHSHGRDKTVQYIKTFMEVISESPIPTRADRTATIAVLKQPKSGVHDGVNPSGAPEGERAA